MKKLKSLTLLLASLAVLYLPEGKLPAADARGAGEHRFPGSGYSGTHCGFPNHYDNFGRWGADRMGAPGAWGGWARPGNRWIRTGWGGWVEPYYGGPGAGYIPGSQPVDEEGTTYPPANYNIGALSLGQYAGHSASETVSAEIKTKPDIEPVRMKPVSTKSVYKLGPDTDVLENGTIAVRLNDKTFLLVDSKQTLVVDQLTGVPSMALLTDPLLLWNLSNELKRQYLGLKASTMNKAANPQTKNTEWILEKLTNAQTKLGNVPEKAPTESALPVPDAVELFASVWLLKDGSFILFKQPDGSLVYLNNKGTFTDRGKTARSVGYPDTFEVAVYGYLKTLVDEYKPTVSKLADDQEDTEWALMKLKEVSDPETDKLESQRRLAEAK